jgi:hypothetical protein
MDILNGFRQQEKLDSAVQPLNGASILRDQDAAAILKSSHKSKGLLDGFEIVGGDVLHGAVNEIENHTLKIGQDLGKGAALGLAADAGLTVAAAGTAALGVVVAPEVAAGATIAAGAAAAGYGIYEIGKSGIRLFHDAKEVIAGKDNPSVADANKDATNFGGTATEAAASLAGGLAGFGRFIVANGESVFNYLGGKTISAPAREIANGADNATQTAADTPQTPGAIESSSVAQQNIYRMENDPNPEVRASLARDEKLPHDVAMKLAQDPSEKVRATLARNKDITGDVFSKLAEDSAPKVRAALTWNKNVPHDLLEQLAHDPSDIVRTNIARNDDSPQDILGQLVNDPSYKVRISLASNSNLAPETTDQLAQDTDEAVRQSLASNLHTPLPVLDQLLRDSSGHVSQFAFLNIVDGRIGGM